MARIKLSRFECMDDELNDRKRFADPGGKSALHPSTRSNPRRFPCPTCGRPNRLTAKDKAKHYQCDECADLLESGLGY